MKENKIRKRVKKLLSVTLTASMLVPSMSYGTIASAAEFEITAPETDEFTDGAGQDEETPVNEAGVAEDAINVFSDGNLNLAVEASNNRKHTVIIDTENYTIGSEWMVDLTNNHDGTITISSAMPEFKGSNKNLRNAYKMIWTGDVDKPYTNEKNYVNPENENGNYWKWSSSHTYDPVYTPINIKPMLYTIFMAISEKDNYVANIQNVESPVRVIYSLDGGTGGPKEDWVWNLDGKWNSDHHKIPTREGYQFTGWYMDNGTKIETVAEAVANAEPIPTEADGRRKEIELKAHWIPIHEQHYWNYISDKNIIKAYCSRTDTQCKYYADSKEHASNYAVLELGLNVSDKDNIIYSGNPVEAEIKTNTITITGATEGKITYKKMNKDTSEYIECNKPVDAGMYKAEVTIGDDNNNATASIEYEIKKATIGNFNVSLESFPYGSPAGIQLSGEPEGSEVTYQYKVKNSEDSEYKSINEEALKTFPVGEYTLKATVRESVNYEGASATCDFKVTKADISSENSKVHISDWTYGSYNVAEHGPSVTNPGNGKVFYTYYTDADCKSPTTSANSGVAVDGELPKNVGTYYVKAEIAATDNYNSATATGSFKIIPRPVKLKWSASEFIYDGEEKSVYATVENALDGDTFKLVYENAKGTNAQEYVAKVTELGNSNYSLEEKDGKPVETISCTWKITKADIKSTSVKMDDWTYGFYDETKNGPSVNANPGNGKVSYTYYTDADCKSPTTSANSGAAVDEELPKNVGTYYVKAEIPETDNYNSTTATGSFKIIPRPAKLKWSASEFTYDGKEKSIYATVENALQGDTFELVYENAKGTNAQEYVAKVTELGNSNYSLEEKDGKPIETISCTWKITKADIKSTSVKMDDWTYGFYDETKNGPSVDTNPGKGNVSYTYYTDKKCTSLTTLANSGAAKDGELPKNVGTYYVKAEIPATDNYNSTTAKGSFKIEPRPAELEWSASKLTYNGEEQKVTATVKNAVSGDNFNLTYDNNIGKEAGNYTTMVKGLGNSNYSLSKDGVLIDTISHSWKIEPKEITVKPNDASKHIGKTDPELTYTADGLVTNEELTGITLTRETGEGSGTYKITATEDKNANPNYKVKTETGTFTIIGHSWSESETKIKPTTWSEGKEERTCTVKECGQKRYDTIPKTGESRDEYADRIEKYVQGSGTEDKNTIREATLNNKETQLLKESNIFGAEEKEKIENQKATAKVWIELTSATLTKEQEDAIRKEAEKFAGTNAKWCPFDMNLFRQMDGEKQVPITDPGINMNIRFRIPDNMINNQSYTIRNYKIIRLHNGTTDILDTSFNSNTNEITFETDKFSVYALTYKDTYYSPSYPVTGIKVSPDTLTLTKKDETAQLTAEVIPSYADNKKVTWKSSDEKVATVDENGKVTAVANGTATITATSVSGNYTATVSVTVKIPVEIEKITIETEKETLTKIGESTELKVKIEPENADPQKLTWKSSDEKVAIVDENGKVTAVSNGTATITVTTEDGKHTASVTITVNIPDEPVISNTTGFGRLKARSTKQTKTSVTLEWSRIDDADGYFIYGSRCNTSTKSYKYKKLATITNGKTRTWTQKDLKKGTYYKYVVKAYKIVNGKKVVTDTSASIHTVTQGGKYGVAKSVSVTKIGNKKNVTKLTLKKGKTAQITAKEIRKDNKIKQHRNLCYESSNTKVATVTSKGLIKAKGKGTCTIWVYAQNGVYKALTITVK